MGRKGGIPPFSSHSWHGRMATWKQNKHPQMQSWRTSFSSVFLLFSFVFLPPPSPTHTTSTPDKALGPGSGHRGPHQEAGGAARRKVCTGCGDGGDAGGGPPVGEAANLSPSSRPQSPGAVSSGSAERCYWRAAARRSVGSGMSEVKLAVLGGSGAGKSGKGEEWSRGAGSVPPAPFRLGLPGTAPLTCCFLPSRSAGGAVPDPALHRRVRVQRR